MAHARLIHNIGESPSKAHHIKANYNTVEEVRNAEGILTFDGVYKNVYNHRALLKGRHVILFVMGDYIGKDNSFDKGMPLEHYCSLRELNELAEIGCKMGWHTHTHPDLTTLSKQEILKEVTPPDWFPRKYFAYPYGRFNDLVIDCIRQVGYEEAYSVFNGDDTAFQKRRDYL